MQICILFFISYYELYTVCESITLRGVIVIIYDIL